MARRSKDLDVTMESEAVEVGAQGRLERLSDSVARLRGGRRIDPDRATLIVGGVLAVIGVIAIFLGWYAAARTPYLFEQIPYLISGGLLGLALAFLGGFAYFAYWVTRVLREARTQSDRTSEILVRIADRLDGASLGNGAGSAPSRSPGGTTFVATKKGTQFHRPDCPVVAGRDGLRRITATKGMVACRICDPGGLGE